MLNSYANKSRVLFYGLLVVALVPISSCSSMHPTSTTQEAYGIYDIKAGSASRSKIENVILHALNVNTDHVNIYKNIPPYPLPKKAGRFQLSKSPLSALVGSASLAKVPTCEGSSLMAVGNMGGIGEQTMYYACLFPYQGGYHLNTYATFTEESINPISPFNLGVIIGKKIGKSIMGGEPVPRTTYDIMEGIKKIGATVKQLEAYP